MLASKKVHLKPLLESSEGIHMTVYLENRGDAKEFKTQLEEAIELAHESLVTVMRADEINKFLEPFEKLLIDPKIFKQLKGHVGLFRHHQLFRMLNLPVPVDPICQIATSFHVKPLLRWLQMDQDFLLIGINDEVANLYTGSQNSFQLIDSILISNSSMKIQEVSIWLKEWLQQLSAYSSSQVFFAGQSQYFDQLKLGLKSKLIKRNKLSDYFHHELAGEICFKVRKYLREQSREIVDQTLTEFYLAEKANKAKKNLFLISKAVVQGRVKKLIISNDSNIYGKIDTKSGGLAIHPCDLDHEDDDILDDLAQIVLKQGGEVVVASKSEMPLGRPVLAILSDEFSPIEKLNFEKEFYNDANKI